MRIAVDVDDTLYDFQSAARDAFIELAVERDDTGLFKGAYHPWTEWRSLSDSCGKEISRDVVRRVHADHVVASRVPFEDAADVLAALHGAGHELHYITNRDPSCHDATSLWLYEHGFPVAQLTCTHDAKLPFIADCQVLIDDRPRTCVEFLYDFDWQYKWGSNNGERKRLAFGLARPHNLNLTDIPRLYLAPTWTGLRFYLITKGLLDA